MDEAGNERRGAQLTGLGLNLFYRYDRLGNLQDLEAAIARFEAAVESIPEDHPKRALVLANLAAPLSDRYKRLGNVQDLEAAITLVEAAVGAIPEDRYHPYRADWLGRLGGLLNRR